MKKHFFFVAASFIAVSVWAQPPGTGWKENFRQREPVSVSGTLVLANGFIALKSGDTLYYTGGLERLVGFVDGLKENAQVRLEGYDFSRVARTQDPAQTATTHFFRVTKLEIDGKSYELNRMAGRSFSGHGPRNFRNGPGSMYGCGRAFDGPAFGRPGFGPSGRRGFDGSGLGPGRHGRGRR
jgi:hypothetical protein